jgi:hypothetical protein
MIITRETAKRMTKKTLSELASEYATEFAHLLGHTGDIIISPEEVIFDKNEAKEVFLKKYDPKTFSMEETKEIAKIMQRNTMHKINQNNAFVQNGIAYIPITNIDENQYKIIQQFQPSNKFIDRVREMFLLGHKNYVLLYGFGSEIAHLTGDKIFQNRVSNGLGEALDMSSSLLEISKDVRTIAKEKESLSIQYDMIEEKINENRYFLMLFDALIFEKDEKVKQIIEKDINSNPNRTDYIFNNIKRDYQMTSHFEGIKLYLEILDSTERNLNETNLKLGEILAKPHVDSIESAFLEFGYTPQQLAKYEGAFGKNIMERNAFLKKKSLN